MPNTPQMIWDPIGAFGNDRSYDGPGGPPRDFREPPRAPEWQSIGGSGYFDKDWSQIPDYARNYATNLGLTQKPLSLENIVRMVREMQLKSAPGDLSMLTQDYTPPTTMQVPANFISNMLAGQVSYPQSWKRNMATPSGSGLSPGLENEATQGQVNPGGTMAGGGSQVTGMANHGGGGSAANSSWSPSSNTGGMTGAQGLAAASAYKPYSPPPRSGTATAGGGNPKAPAGGWQPAAGFKVGF